MGSNFKLEVIQYLYTHNKIIVVSNSVPWPLRPLNLFDTLRFPQQTPQIPILVQGPSHTEQTSNHTRYPFQLQVYQRHQNRRIRSILKSQRSVTMLFHQNEPASDLRLFSSPPRNLNAPLCRMLYQRMDSSSCRTI